MKVQFSLRIDEDLLKKLKMEALQNDEMISDCIVKNCLYGLVFNEVDVCFNGDAADLISFIDEKTSLLFEDYL